MWGNSSCGLHSGGWGYGPRVTGLYTVGMCGSVDAVCLAWGVGLFVAGVCGSPDVRGGGFPVMGLSLAGVCGIPRAGRGHSVGFGVACDGRVWATG